jgi:hypothetical protein
MPRVSRNYRIRLSRVRVSKEWRDLAIALDKATDEVAQASPGRVDSAVKLWRKVASRALECRFVTPRTLRDRLKLASVLVGEPYVLAATLAHTPLQAAIEQLVSATYWQEPGGGQEERKRLQRRRARRENAAQAAAQAARPGDGQ